MPLPGVKTTILDRFYNQSRTDLPGGPLVSVIAKRSNTDPGGAPSLTPYFATNERDVIEKFGENSQIHKAYYELTTSGAPRISLIALPSDSVFTQAEGIVESVSAGLTGDGLFNGAIAAAEAGRTDVLVLWGSGSTELDWDDVADPATPGGGANDYFYADNSVTITKSWAKKLSDACNSVTLESHPMMGVIGVKGIVGLENPTPAQIAAGVQFTSLADKNNVAFPSTGHLVSVVGTELHILGAPLSWGWSNGACAYAASVIRLDAWSSTTGKPVFNVDRVRYNPTRSQLETMTSKGVVGVHIDFRRSPRWVDGLTFAKDTSDYSRLTTVRIVFDAVKLVRTISQSYIGETMSIDKQQAFQTQISSALQSMQRLGALNNSDFRVLYAPRQNRASVDLALTPAFELREVLISVSVNF
jgi:hypothetical protein